MNRYQLAAMSVLFAVVATLGCNNSMVGSQGNAAATSGGGVAVIDLDEIGKELGRTEDIDKKITDRQNQLKGELEQLQARLRTQLENHQKTLPEEPTDTDKQTLARLQNELNTQLAQAQRRAQIDIANLRSNLVGELRDEIKPHALEVAKSRGRDVVLSKLLNNSPLYVYADEVDITAEVLAKMKPGAPAPAPAPAENE